MYRDARACQEGGQVIAEVVAVVPEQVILLWREHSPHLLDIFLKHLAGYVCLSACNAQLPKTFMLAFLNSGVGDVYSSGMVLKRGTQTGTLWNKQKRSHPLNVRCSEAMRNIPKLYDVHGAAIWCGACKPGVAQCHAQD